MIYTVRLILEAIFFIWLINVINRAIELFFDVNLIDIIKKYVKRLIK